jgi:hypothetical protein
MKSLEEEAVTPNEEFVTKRPGMNEEFVTRNE